MFKVLVLFYLCSLGFSAEAINPDFYKQQKVKKATRAKRERGADKVTKGRKDHVRTNEKKAKAYTKKRHEIQKEREKREKLSAKDLEQKLKFRERKVAQAAKLAKKRRLKTQVSWSDENIEYGIRVPKAKKAN